MQFIPSLLVWDINELDAVGVPVVSDHDAWHDRLWSNKLLLDDWLFHSLEGLSTSLLLLVY